ncbi:MAG: hypothetical protein DCO96_14580 [Fluviicola sp. XM-24bin1]|nr:MAG: hypothetical protein DCO96_14580 [Fluviicola sp. XM-24bin1]
MIPLKEFNKSGFPVIRFREDYFEVKAMDYWEFRSFKYSEVVKIDYYHYRDRWWFGMGVWSFFMSTYDARTFKIVKENGVSWKYNAHREYKQEFADVVKEFINRCGLERTR